MNKIESLVKKFKENASGRSVTYTDTQINNIVINCMSVIKTWFDNNKPTKGESYKLTLCDEDSMTKETLYGLTQDNVCESVLSIISKNDGNYASVVLTSYMYANGKETDIRELGKMDIS